MYEERCVTFRDARYRVGYIRDGFLQLRNMSVLAFYIRTVITTFNTKHEVWCFTRIPRYETPVYSQGILRCIVRNLSENVHADIGFTCLVRT